MMNPKLTVILPVYNVESFLEEALDSLFNQKFKDYSVIAVNDGSTDNSPVILEKYSKVYSNMKIIHQDNHGLSDARNKGLNKARGKYIYFFDSDDKIDVELFNNLIPAMERYSAEIVTFSGECISQEGNVTYCGRKYRKPNITFPVTGEELFEMMISENLYSPAIPTYLYKREFLIKNNLYFSKGYLHEDEAFSIKALGLAKAALSFSTIYFYRRIRSGSIMNSPKGKNNCIGILQAASEILNFLNFANIKDSTRKHMEARALLLIHNAINIIHLLNNKFLKEEMQSRYFDKKSFQGAGSRIWFHLNYPFLYKVISKFNL